MSSKGNCLILSIDEQDWMKAEDRMKEIGTKRCYVMIVGINDTFLEGHKGLCKDAIYVQKTHNIYKYGKKLGIPKIVDLGYKEGTDLHKFVAQIQLQILIGGVKNILVSRNKLLIDIINKIKKTFDSLNIEYI